MKLLIGTLLGLLAGVSAMYGPGDDVVELTPANFNNLVINGNGLWMIEFYAPWCGHCKSLAPEWKKAAKALKGIVNVGAVDMDQHQSLGAPYNIKGFPTIKVFGEDKNKPTDYSGARNADGVVDSAMSNLKNLVKSRLSGRSGGSSSGGGSQSGGSSGGSGSGDTKDVVELTDGNFEELVLNSNDLWLVEFFAPWCGHCKTLAPQWAAAAAELRGKVKLGALDSTVHTVVAGRYGIRGYPTIKSFPAGRKDGEADDYEGGRTTSDIVAWALDKVSANLPSPEVVQLTDAEVLAKACNDHQLCVIAILPHILDCQSECRNEYLRVLTQMGEKYKKRMWGWVWAEAVAQPQLEESLGIGGFGYPAMAAVNSRKMKFSIMRGSFSETGINEYLRELAVGRGSTAPINGAALPKVLSTEPWDGKDGELPEEEEYDLSDVDLDDMDLDDKIEL